MDYWNDLLTEESWGKLQELKKSGLKFILIGGWATWLWARTHKSRDIDIVIEFGELEKFRKLHGFRKNDRLRKYELKTGEIDIDIYVPHYSKLSFPLEKLQKHSAMVEGFRVAEPEALLILKQGAEMDRGESEKGIKDRIDIMSILLNAGIDFRKYFSLLKTHDPKEYRQRLVKIVKQFREHDYLGLNPRELKLKKKEILEKMELAR